MPAGSQSIAAVRRVRPAAQIVDDLLAGAREACDRDDLTTELDDADLDA